nr:helix-turn-helix domain-containing protein [Rhodoplanes elegans]
MEAHILNLWHQRSTDKVLAFLAQIQRRQRQTPNGFVSLPMSRNDIADYLGLSVETVSRALTELKQRGILEFGGTRQLKIARPSDSLLSLPLYADSNQLMTAA